MGNNPGKVLERDFPYDDYNLSISFDNLLDLQNKICLN